jgi:hypothetical protein
MRMVTAEKLTMSATFINDGIFADPDKWELELTEGVIASVQADPTKGKDVLRFDYDFNGRTGYVLMRRKVDIALPDNYAFSFGLEGKSPDNSLQMKLIDPDGETVWWNHRPSFQFPRKREVMRNKKRHFTFGWGPKKGPLERVGFIDLCVTATVGGRGTVWFDDLRFAELPPDPSGPIAATVKATSGNRRPHGIFGEQSTEMWETNIGGRQELRIELGEDREFGGMIIDWGEKMPSKFDVEIRASFEDDWRRIHSASDNRCPRTWVHAPECEASEIRVRMHKSRFKDGYQVNRIALQDLAFSKSKNDFFAEVSKSFRRGAFPRQTLREMPFWTVIGVCDDTSKALINEDGMVELEKQGCSLEPFIELDDGLLTWADGEQIQSLQDGYLPLPKVLRKHDAVELSVKPWVSGMPGQSQLYVEYVVRNTSQATQRGRLAIALRPFQVNPPWQFLNWPGGFSPINSLQWRGNTAVINGRKHVNFHAEGGITCGATNLERGDIYSHLTMGTLPRARQVRDENGFASGAAVKQFSLAPGEQMRVFVTSGMHDNNVFFGDPDDEYAMQVDYWRRKLSCINVKLPPSAREIEQTLKAQFGYILVNRRGKAIQPGSRCYDRSWARDGALTSSALLHFGFHQEVKDFISWFAPHQFENGKVPCVVDHAGADPLPEHDSPGEFIFLIAEYLRYTGDHEFVRTLMPRVLKTVEYIEALLRENKEQSAHLRGILPPSVSHEGYFDKAAYSYWDDFWCMKGLDDASYLAHEFMGEGHFQARQIKELAVSFRQSLYSSIRAAMKHHGIDFVPGSADRGDFDATSTTIALDPAMQLSNLLPEFHQTFQKWWSFFLMRRSNQLEWNGYTPYELRSVGAYIRLGQRGIAHEVLDWFMSHRRPLGWRHWAEVVHRDPKTPISVGDMPHTWVGSDFVRSVRNFLVYEREDGAIVVGAGIKYDWMFEPNGEMSFALNTPRGTIKFSGRRSGYRYRICLEGNCSAPVVLQLPYWAKAVRIDGRVGQLELPVRLPAEIVVDLD